MIKVTNIKVEMGYKPLCALALRKPHLSLTSKPSKTFYDKENTMRTPTIFLAAALLAASLAAQASGSHAGGHAHDGPSIGQPGQADKVSRTVSIDMQDNMRFVPATVAVKQGETIRFVVRNTGALAHELVLGNIKDLKAHAKAMQKFPDMEHDEPNMLGLAPGQAAGALLAEWLADQPTVQALLQQARSVRVEEPRQGPHRRPRACIS